MDRHELAWAAGFFDGEGWAGLVRHGRGDALRPQARINQAGDARVPEVLERFRSALDGVGAIGGPYFKNSRRDLYWWSVSSKPDVAEVLRLLAPWLCALKLRQLTTAASASCGTSAGAQADEWMAWAAGLFDAEGCSALLHHRTHEGYMTPELSVTQSSRAGSPEVLERFVATVAAGAISGPYIQRKATMPVYRWKASARSEVESVLASLWPHLGSVKRAQAQQLLDTLVGQPALPRGNPAFGYHKTHCVHGHEYAVARMRSFVARAGGEAPRENQKCLACLREYARAQREKRRSALNTDRRSLGEPVSRYAYFLK